MNERPRPRQIDSWEVAEENAAAWMRYWGFADAGVTQGGADGGVDVASRTALAQVKFEARQVGSPALQRLVGARRTDYHLELLFFSGVGYAAPAVDYADVMNIALFKYDLLGVMTPVNHRARALVNASRSRVSADGEAGTGGGDVALAAAAIPAAGGAIHVGKQKRGHGWWFRNWMLVLAGWWTYLSGQRLVRFAQDGVIPLGWGNFAGGLVAIVIVFGIWLSLGRKRRQWKLDRDAYLARVSAQRTGPNFEADTAKGRGSFGG